MYKYQIFFSILSFCFVLEKLCLWGTKRASRITGGSEFILKFAKWCLQHRSVSFIYHNFIWVANGDHPFPLLPLTPFAFLQVHAGAQPASSDYIRRRHFSALWHWAMPGGGGAENKGNAARVTQRQKRPAGADLRHPARTQLHPGGAFCFFIASGNEHSLRSFLAYYSRSFRSQWRYLVCTSVCDSQINEPLWDR